MRAAAFLILIAAAPFASAQVSFSCGGSGGAIDCALSASSPALSGQASPGTALDPATGGQRPSSEVTIANALNNAIFLEATASSPAGLISILADNAGIAPPAFQASAAGALYQGVAKNADSVNVIADVLGSWAIDVGGYNGQAGEAVSRLCADKINSGFFGDARADDLIRQRQNALVAGGASGACDAPTLSYISSVAPVNFCPPGFTYRPELDNAPASSVSLSISRKPVLYECAATLQSCSAPDPSGTIIGCIDNGGSFMASFIYVPTASCPAGYSLATPGGTQGYPCPYASDASGTVTACGPPEASACSPASCPEGILNQSFNTTYGATIAMQPGQSGSYGGSVNVMAYDLGSMSVRFANGSNGATGVDDLSPIAPFTKYCARVLDDTSATLDANSPERRVPTASLFVDTFYPLAIVPPSGLPSVSFPVKAQSEAVGVFKKMDSSARDYAFACLIQGNCP
jgi:hypothetical protein